MKKRVGILTSGGDCPGLNATIRGVAKALYARMGENVEIVGILNGYSGLINGDYKEMCEDDFRGILTLGGRQIEIVRVQELAPQPLVILEGSYSHHPLLAGYETLQVFVTCSREEQTRRLQAREGERYANFAARWIPLEEGYFAQYRIEETADLAVDTTAANACAGTMCR